MDTAPLFNWLALPPGPWPPDDRTLLGLPPDGHIDAATAEANAIERMELIRVHQLMQPELVTEGMNRLAQALIAVTTPSPLVPLTSPVVSLTTASPPPAEVVILEAEVIEVAPVRQPPLPPTTAPPKLTPPLPLPHEDLAPILLAEEPAPPGAAVVPNNRRKAYRELVFLRKLRRLWERLGPLAGVPSEPVRTAESVFVVLTAGRQLRELLDTNPAAATIIARDGRLVTSVFTQPHATVVLRELVPNQRARLAADWATARSLLDTGYTALRLSLRKSVPRNRMRTWAADARAHLRANPEWVLGFLTVVLILAGLLRLLWRAAPGT